MNDFTGLFKNRIEHGFSQPAGEGVLLAGVVGLQHPAIVWKWSRASMCEARSLERGRGDLGPEHLESDLPERYKNACFGKKRELFFKKGRAGFEFRRKGLVSGRSASTCTCDPRVSKEEPIASRSAFCLSGKARFVKCAVEPISGSISSEDASCPIRAVRTGRKTHEHQASLRIPEAGHGLSPVILIAVSSALHACDLCAVLAESRTAVAGDDLFFEAGE